MKKLILCVALSAFVYSLQAGESMNPKDKAACPQKAAACSTEKAAKCPMKSACKIDKSACPKAAKDPCCKSKPAAKALKSSKDASSEQ